jgi:hypothetical protein
MHVQLILLIRYRSGDKNIWVRDDFYVKNFETSYSHLNKIIIECFVQCLVAERSKEESHIMCRLVISH